MITNSDHKVISFDSALKEVQNLIYLHIKTGTKRSNFYTGFWEGFTGHVANWLLEKPDGKNSHTVSPEYASLHQTNCGG